MTEFRQGHPPDAHGFLALFHAEILVSVLTHGTPAVAQVLAIHADDGRSLPMAAFRSQQETIALKQPMTPEFSLLAAEVKHGPAECHGTVER